VDSDWGINYEPLRFRAVAGFLYLRTDWVKAGTGLAECEIRQT